MNPSSHNRERGAGVGAGAGVIISASFMPRVCQVTGHTYPAIHLAVERILFCCVCVCCNPKGEGRKDETSVLAICMGNNFRS